MAPYRPEPEQIAAIARWLGREDVASEIGALMPLCGGPRSACKRRVIDVANALTVIAACGDALTNRLDTP